MRKFSINKQTAPLLVQRLLQIKQLQDTPEMERILFLYNMIGSDCPYLHAALKLFYYDHQEYQQVLDNALP